MSVPEGNSRRPLTPGKPERQMQHGVKTGAEERGNVDVVGTGGITTKTDERAYLS